MNLLEHLQEEHADAVRCAVTLNGLLKTKKGCVISHKKLESQLQQLEEKKIKKQLEAKYKLAKFSKEHGLFEEDSLNLAKDICTQLGVSEEDFKLANEYKLAEHKHDKSWQGADI